MPTEDTSDEAIRNRLFEMMPKYPSKDACKMHLRREGFPPDAVERIVDEIYAIRKQVVTKRITDEHAMIGVLVSVLDGDAPLPSDAETLEPVARKYGERLMYERSSLTLLLRGYGLAVLVVAMLTIWSPQMMLVLALIPLKRIWIAVAVYGAILGGIANAISSIGRLKRNSIRTDALRQLAGEQGWRNVRI
jgi:hypothetical protein